MTHDEAFLADICADPADDAPRLIYADWLDEHGQPERAEFIRLQCATARMESTDPRRPTLVARAWRLREEHEGRWLGRLRPALVEWHFRRGFIEKVTLDGRVRSAYVAALFCGTPLRHLRLAQATNGMLETILRSVHLAHLETLDLSRNELTYADVEGLACCPRLSGLRCLRLNFNGISDSGAQILAYSRHLQGVGRMELMGNPIWKSGREYLAAYHGDRVAFVRERDSDHLYPIRSAYHRNLDAGVSGDCQVLMLGEYERVLTLFFDLEGEFLHQRSRAWPRRSQDYSEFDELWEATRRPWQEELGFRPATIRVKKFMGPEGEPAIADYPSTHEDFLLRPEQFSDEEREGVVRFLCDDWEPRGQFVFYCGNDYWIDNTGEVVAS